MRSTGSSAAAKWIALQLLALAALATAASAQAAPALTPPVDEIERADARDAYGAGLRAFARGAFTEAAREFTRADGLSSSPNARLMLGRCLHQLQQLPEAYRVLITIVRPPEALDPRYAQTRAAAEEELRVLRSQIGLLTVYVRANDRSSLLHVDDRQIQPNDWNSALAVRPGVVRISLETAPGVIDRREIEVGAGQHTSLVIGAPDQVAEHSPTSKVASKPRTAKPVPPRPNAARVQAIEARPPSAAEPAGPSSTGPSALRIGSYIAGGTSALSFIAFGILGTLSAANFAKLEDGCPDRNLCDSDLEAIAARGQTQQVLANIALVVGVSTLVAGASLFILSQPPETKKTEDAAVLRKNAGRRQARSARLALAVTPLGVALQGAL
jgi:hypothetical protein